MNKKDAKVAFDKILKDFQFQKTPMLFSYSQQYDNYFMKDYLSALIEKMGEENRVRYEKGAGSEMKSHSRNGHIFPPSMLSTASSSRFCVESLCNCDLSVFGGKTNTKPLVEEKLPIFPNGTPPHMDAVIKEENLFFECKCHEFLDYHSIVLSKSYFEINSLCEKIDKKYLSDTVIKTKTSSGDYKLTPAFIIEPDCFGLKKGFMFDIKQLLTHLMGIAANTSNPSKLMYYYFIPDDISNIDIVSYRECLYSEIPIVCNNKIISDFCKEKNIQIEVYVQFSRTMEPASSANTRKVWPE